MIVLYIVRDVSSGLRISWWVDESIEEEETMTVLEIVVIVFAILVCVIGTMICIWVHKKSPSMYRVYDDNSEVEPNAFPVLPTVELTRQDIERCMPIVKFDLNVIEVAEDVCSI
jgi:hypothetical protein